MIHGAVNIRTPTFRPYENLWRSPIGQPLDCAITGYKYPVHSHFSEPLPTVNWPTSPRRNSLPLFSHHKSGIQSWLWIFSKTTSKIVLVANLQYPENIRRRFRLQTCLTRKSSISPKYSKTFSPAELSWPQIIKTLEIFREFFASKQYPSCNQQLTSNQQQQPAAATSSSNQQQQSTAPINSSNQQWQPATATSIHPSTSTHATTSIHPTSSTYTIDASLC